MLLTIEYTRRGDLVIFLTTPMGTRTCLLPVRSEDSSDEGFKRWAFMSTHAWGEDPRGKWTLELKDGGESRSNVGVLKDWQLVLHGTRVKPLHQNITHPDVPTHKKAVPDDVKNTARSSVQITQITYTFGEQHPPSSSQTIVPTNDQLNLFNTPAMYAPQVVVPPPQPVVNAYQNPPAASTPALLGAEYNYNTNNNLNPYLRNSIPSYPLPSNNYLNLFNSPSLLTPLTTSQIYQNANSNAQNNVNTGLVGRSVPWQQQKLNALQFFGNPKPLFGSPNGNLWNFFGRYTNGKRSMAQRRRRNSFIEFIEQLRSNR